MASSSMGFATACKRAAARGTEALKGAFEWVRDGGRKRQLGVGAAAVGVAAAITLATMSAQAESGTFVTAEGYPAGTTAIADPSTLDAYKTFPTGDSYDSTEYAGRIWTDKTVIVPKDASDPSKLGKTAVIDLADSTRDFDGDSTAASAGEAEVDMTDRSVFLTCVSALSSSLVTQLYEPTPLDIVLVLDMSGSMTDPYSGATNVPYASYEIEALRSGQSLPNTKFRNRSGSLVSKAGFEGYCLVSENADGSGAVRVPYINKYANGNDFYILTTDADQEGTQEQLYYQLIDGDQYNTPTDTWQQYNFCYTQLYHNTVDKVFALKNGVVDFVDAISANNKQLYDQGYTESSMSRISVVQFASWYTGGSSSWASNVPDYTIKDSSVNDPTTHIVTPLTTYMSESADPSIADSTEIRNVIGSLAANQRGATAADYGLTLAQGVFDGQAHYPNSLPEADAGAREGAKKIIVFFTDGNPKHGNGQAPKDFSGLIAQETLEIAKQLKSEDIDIYSVAVLDGADADDTTKNANIYLNGVSSNYPLASATGGVDNPALGTAEPAADTWTPVLGERAEGTYYYVAGGDTSLSEAFGEIAANITSGGGDATATGRDGNTALTITDYLGDYMEFKGLDGILYGVSADATQFYAPGTQRAYHTEAQVQFINQTSTESIYTMWASVPSALLSPPEGKENVNLSSITVKVTRSSDAKTGDTVTITIPPDLVPSLRYLVAEQNTGSGISTEVSRTDADPLRIFYSVGPKTNTLDSVLARMEDESLRAENATNDSDRQSDAFRSFMQDAARYGMDGIYSLYSNRPTYGEGDNAYTVQPADKGEATASMVLSKANPYYFFVENEPLFVETAEGSGEYRPAESADAGADLYYRARVWSVNENNESEKYYEWGGTPMDEEGLLCIPAGTIKTPENTADAMTNASFDKSENTTGTASTSLVSVFDGSTEAATGNYVAQQYLGNNGRLDIPVYGTLAVTKNITAGEGFNLPTNPVPSAHFTLEIKDKDGGALTQDDTYRALIRNAAGHPIDPETHAVATDADTAKFYVKNGSEFTLRDGETIKVTNLPDGATYQVKEDGQPGYKATVTNNNGSQQEFDRGVDAVTKDATGA